MEALKPELIPGRVPLGPNKADLHTKEQNNAGLSAEGHKEVKTL